LPEPPIPPAPVPSQSKSLDPNQLLPGQDWKPGSGPTVRLYPPEIVESDGGGAGGSAPGGKKILLRPPEVIEEGNSTPKSDGGGPPKSSAVPPGIPQFAVVRDGVASGLRPSLEGGLDWLQANGYKTVVCLHQPGEPDATDRKQAEKRGMLFVSFEVSPGTLTPKALDDFNALVADGGNLPLFVYDRDGALAGAMWYLHFRVAQKADEESARTQANGLGLHEDRGGLHREMWQAAQKLVISYPR